MAWLLSSDAKTPRLRGPGRVQHYAWQGATTAAALGGALELELAQLVERAGAVDLVVSAPRIGGLIRALRASRLLADPRARQKVMSRARKSVEDRIAGIVLDGPEAQRQLVAALELVTSLGDDPDRGGANADLALRVRALTVRLELRRGDGRVLGTQLAAVEAGDSGDRAREPHLAATFFGMLFGAEPEKRARRAAALAKAFVGARILRVEAPLWFHLLARGGTEMRAVFAENRRRVVERVLRAALDDEATFARLISEAGLGVGHLAIGLDEAGARALAALRRTREPSTWLHVGDATSAIGAAPELGRRRAIARALGVGPPSLVTSLAVVRDPEARLLEAKELRACDAEARRLGLRFRDVVPAAPRALAGLVGARRRPLVITDVGRYFGSPAAAADRASLRALGGDAGRFIAMSHLAALVALLRPGDALVLAAGDAYVAAMRRVGLRALTLEVGADARPAITYCEVAAGASATRPRG